MWPYLQVKKYLKTWTLPVFFPFTHLSLLPVPVRTSAPEWGDLVFFPCWFCLCCSVISSFPEEISTKLGWLPGQPVWDAGRIDPSGQSHLHISSPPHQPLHLQLQLTLASSQQICKEPWTKHHLDPQQGREKSQDGRQGKQTKRQLEGFFFFQTMSTEICHMVLMIAVSAVKETEVQKDTWMCFPPLHWESKPKEKWKKELARCMDTNSPNWVWFLG